jgi:sulfate permease, SulP family
VDTGSGSGEPRLHAGLKRIARAARTVPVDAAGHIRAYAKNPDRRAAAARAGHEARAFGARHGGDALAGMVAALVTIAYCISFSALVFQGDLRGGLAMGLWALLTGAAITGIIVAMTTTLPPAEAGPDNPAIAVFSVLAMTIGGAVMSAGGSAELAVRHALIGMTLATVLTGVVLWVLGRFRLGALVRFVPFPVIGGFLAASGWLLVTGGIEVITGREITPATIAGAVGLADLPKVGIAFAFAVSVLAVRQHTGYVFTLPVAFFGLALVLDIILALAGAGTPAHGWYVKDAGVMTAWIPLASIFAPDIHWGVFLRVLPEMGAVAAVTVLALLLDISSLEVARSKVADLDAEFRSNGAANMVAAPLGGFVGNLSLNASRMLEETGGRTRLCGLYAALVIGTVVVSRFDLTALVPTPVLGGLLIFMGLIVLREALVRSPARRSWVELGLALAIMSAIIQFGYLTGVVFGFIGACLLFAFNYGRIGVIRRHVTRAAFASNVERSDQDRLHLEGEGDRIHVFWLTGFIFFGSSNGMFERISTNVGPRKRPGERFVVLDFHDVSGCDTSALLSMVKLRNWGREHAVRLVWAGLADEMRATLTRAGLFDGREPAIFPTRTEAIEWCEERVLSEATLFEARAELAPFEDWLADVLGQAPAERLLRDYLERREYEGGELLCTQGGAPDTIDLVAQGSVAVTITDDDGRAVRVRRMVGQTVVGEMGFFRGVPRAASVIADGPTVVFVLTRDRYTQLIADDPELGALFLQFIVRVLSDRVAFANKEIAALL